MIVGAMTRMKSPLRMEITLRCRIILKWGFTLNFLEWRLCHVLGLRRENMIPERRHD